MKLLLIVDSHIYKTNDGKYWCKGITDRAFFERYLKVFEKIKIVSRIQKVDNIDEKIFLRVDSDEIEFVEMPFIRRTKDYILNYRIFIKKFKEGMQDCDCAIFRLPSILSYITYNTYKKTGKPSAVEIVADPEYAYSDFKFLSVFLKYKLKKIAKNSDGVSYVTEKYLQSIYPSKITLKDSDRFESFYSSIDLSDDFFDKKRNSSSKSEYIIAHTANISKSMVKGQDVLIRALGVLKKNGYKVKCNFIGDSEIKDKYYEIARECNVLEDIKFTGLITDKNEFRNILKMADIFVLPTKAEGLPRSVIEAMALGIPCVSTPVNGIPELLTDEFMVAPNDYEGFAKIIKRLIDNPQIMNEASERNIEKAKEYRYEILQERRIEFYKKLRSLVEKL